MDVVVCVVVSKQVVILDYLCSSAFSRSKKAFLKDERFLYRSRNLIALKQINVQQQNIGTTKSTDCETQ